jgi:LuxR family maltose regulon positive regulatory protein
MDRLLRTKLAAPRPSYRPIRRQRLVELLSRTLRARLTLLSAPPGYGKTTALVDWLDSAAIRSAWVSLDETDNDPVRFHRYLWAAVVRLAADDADTAAAELPDVADAGEAIGELPSLLTDRDEPVVLVLDDYHLISSPAVQRAMTRFLERLPARAHLVIATRADPPLPLARLRARGELVEVRADALRFSAEEARAFLAERMALALSDEDVSRLMARAEGWPAILQLAGLALAGQPDIQVRVREFAATHRFVLDYVVEEVLAGLPMETVAFLLRTSILERLTGPLCDAVTGVSGGQERLEALERANLLIMPLDDERRWYRYHALFADVLRARLAVLHPDELGSLHARASAWYESQGDDDAAVAHALASGDLERASRVVAIASGRRLSGGELTTVRRWLGALPEQLVRTHAQLSASYAWCQLLAGETAGVAVRLADAERTLTEGDDGGPALRLGIPCQLALLRSQLAGMQGDPLTAVAQARLAGECIPAGLPPEGEANLRGTATALLALALVRSGDPEAAAAAYEQAIPNLRASGNRLALGRTIADLASLAIAAGDPARAAARCEAELGRGGGPASAAGSGAVWAALARARLELGQATAAETAARRALELATRAGDVPVARSADETLARIEALPPASAGARANGRPAAAGLVEPLTDRELEVLRLVALGRSNSQVASALFVTVGTVKSHLHAVSGKLGAANRVEAVARARALGWLD